MANCEKKRKNNQVKANMFSALGSLRVHGGRTPRLAKVSFMLHLPTKPSLSWYMREKAVGPQLMVDLEEAWRLQPCG